jgi:polyferredoxin
MQFLGVKIIKAINDMFMKNEYLQKMSAIMEKHIRGYGIPVLSTVILTAGMFIIVQIMVERPMLMVDRYFPGMGWIEILFLSLYAGFMTPKILNPQTSVRWRTILWLTFSIIFFTQLTLGIIGLNNFLMTGKLHLPVPALIIAGPIYRGENFFMPILFICTLLVIGPAWCSYFCYIGGWDFFASQQRVKNSKGLHKWRQILRVTILILVVCVAYALRHSELPVSVAVWLTVIFGFGGIAMMIFVSRKTGTMSHCITYCPIGMLANVLGKISPFRLRINDSCTGCRKCSIVCRYDALRPENLNRKKPGLSCTLCGDCIGSCKGEFIKYSFPGLSSRLARTIFVIIVVSFHAVSIGIARI